MNAIEYKRITLPIIDVAKPELETQLNQLGSEGWELVSVISHEKHGYSAETHLIFKRPKTA